MSKADNVYSRLQAARVAMQNRPLKKSGENKFAGFTYFELGDFLPTANKVLLEHGLFARVFFRKMYAYLEVRNIDKPEERILFTSPMAEASLKGCHPIQNVGAIETYQRRYLYMLALELVEHDILDASVGVAEGIKKAPVKEKKTDDMATENQLKAIYAVAKGLMKAEEIKEYIFGKYGVQSSKELTKKQAMELLDFLNARKGEGK